jgi:hypothetical protein
VASYVSSTSKVHEIDRTLHNREVIICIAEEKFLMAQNQMKQKEINIDMDIGLMNGINCYFTCNLINIHHSNIEFHRR